VFLSDEAIKKRIKSSMLKERNKWKQARQDYLKVIRSLRDMGVDVDVPPTLDQLLMNSKPKDANKMLLNLARKVKTHLVS
jgi:TnpA family transposase